MRVWKSLIPAVLLALPAVAQTPGPLGPAPTPRPLSTAPAPAEAHPPAPPAPPDDVRMIRYKISAGDLPSAESILEFHRAEKGEDGDYLVGLAWATRERR